MEAAAQDGAGVGYGVAEIEGGDGVEDEFKGIGPILAGLAGEAVEAFRALEELQCS